MMTEGQRRQRLIDWLEVIYGDIQQLLLDDYVFWQLQEVVRTNPRFKRSSGLLTQWMASSFAQSAAVGVRRHAKTKDCVSLMRFLQEVEKYPFLVSRAHYARHFVDLPDWHKEIAQRDFDRLAGQGRETLPLVLFQKQRAELAAAVRTIEHYVDKRVAHYDSGGAAPAIPVFHDLSVALKELERLTILYWRLLKGPSMDGILPVIQFDWQDVLRFAWIPRRAKRSRQGSARRAPRSRPNTAS